MPIAMPHADISLRDFRALQPNPPDLPKQKHKIVGWGRRRRVLERRPQDVTGIVLHQTAVLFGPDGPENKERRLRRALGVACHVMAFGPDRTVVLANPFSWYVWHGDGLNASTLGLETSGRFSGLLDDPSTTPIREDIRTTWDGKEPTVITDDIIETTCEALRIMHELAVADGMPIQWLYAHRQSSPNRRSDPGEGIWRPCADYAVHRLGLRVNPGYVHPRTGGRMIPRQWDPVRGQGPY